MSLVLKITPEGQKSLIYNDNVLSLQESQLPDCIRSIGAVLNIDFCAGLSALRDIPNVSYSEAEQNSDIIVDFAKMCVYRQNSSTQEKGATVAMNELGFYGESLLEMRKNFSQLEEYLKNMGVVHVPSPNFDEWNSKNEIENATKKEEENKEDELLPHVGDSADFFDSSLTIARRSLLAANVAYTNAGNEDRAATISEWSNNLSLANAACCIVSSGVGLYTAVGEKSKAGAGLCGDKQEMNMMTLQEMRHSVNIVGFTLWGSTCISGLLPAGTLLLACDYGSVGLMSVASAINCYCNSRRAYLSHKLLNNLKMYYHPDKKFGKDDAAGALRFLQREITITEEEALDIQTKVDAEFAQQPLVQKYKQRRIIEEMKFLIAKKRAKFVKRAGSDALKMLDNHLDKLIQETDHHVTVNAKQMLSDLYGKIEHKKYEYIRDALLALLSIIVWGLLYAEGAPLIVDIVVSILMNIYWLYQSGKNLCPWVHGLWLKWRKKHGENNFIELGDIELPRAPSFMPTFTLGANSSILPSPVGDSRDRSGGREGTLLELPSPEEAARAVRAASSMDEAWKTVVSRSEGNWVDFSSAGEGSMAPSAFPSTGPVDDWREGVEMAREVKEWQGSGNNPFTL